MIGYFEKYPAVIHYMLDGVGTGEHTACGDFVCESPECSTRAHYYEKQDALLCLDCFDDYTDEVTMRYSDAT